NCGGFHQLARDRKPEGTRTSCARRRPDAGEHNQWPSRRLLQRGSDGSASLLGRRGARRMTEERKAALERQARHVAKLGLSSVEHIEAVVAGARKLLETGAIVPPSDEENPYL